MLWCTDFPVEDGVTAECALEEAFTGGISIMLFINTSQLGEFQLNCSAMNPVGPVAAEPALLIVAG